MFVIICLFSDRNCKNREFYSPYNIHTHYDAMDSIWIAYSTVYFAFI